MRFRGLSNLIAHNMHFQNAWLVALAIRLLRIMAYRRIVDLDVIRRWITASSGAPRWTWGRSFGFVARAGRRWRDGPAAAALVKGGLS